MYNNNIMEQHVENVIKSYKERELRRVQFEKELALISLSDEHLCEMRRIFSEKESRDTLLKQAKMEKSMFTKIKLIGVSAFGEVTLVRKIDTKHLYALKTLKKAHVLKLKQVAHVIAERDILGEADNEWVVKLYYSFQDKHHIYFVMDYIPGGDLMSLLIKLGIFEEHLARFYIAELTCAVESVHKMGFIHRDIKPDSILIDRDGHIKLTDFGLCTGFRWTHNYSKYYQDGEHCRQDSMGECGEEWGVNGAECRCHQLKPLERRPQRKHQRCDAHFLVGMPNYIAPEVLLGTGYTQLCDWWSVGVILYEMLVGSAPFLAITPSETQYKVINWKNTLQIPASANLSPEGADLILKLCTCERNRLGKNADEVKIHPFFKDTVFERRMRCHNPPYVPRITFSTDTSNFDPILKNELEQIRNEYDLCLTEKNNLKYELEQITLRCKELEQTPNFHLFFALASIVFFLVLVIRFYSYLSYLTGTSD